MKFHLEFTRCVWGKDIETAEMKEVKWMGLNLGLGKRVRGLLQMSYGHSGESEPGSEFKGKRG